MEPTRSIYFGRCICRQSVDVSSFTLPSSRKTSWDSFIILRYLPKSYLLSPEYGTFRWKETRKKRLNSKPSWKNKLMPRKIYHLSSSSCIRSVPIATVHQSTAQSYTVVLGSMPPYLGISFGFVTKIEDGWIDPSIANRQNQLYLC